MEFKRLIVPLDEILLFPKDMYSYLRDFNFSIELARPLTPSSVM